MLAIPGLNHFLGIIEFERRDENRVFKDSVEVNLRQLDKLPKEVELYVQDNFAFRSPLLDMYHNLKYSVFKSSPHPDQTLIGKDNWYFMSGKELEIYEGAHSFSESDLANLKTTWTYRKHFLDSMDIPSYWIIAPFKHYVYKDQLPFNISQSTRRRVDQLKDYFQEDLPDFIIDPLPVLIEKRKEKKLFYRLDNHWNFWAGLYTTDLLLNRLKNNIEAPSINDLPKITWDKKVAHDGYHFNVLGIDTLSEVKQIPVFENSRVEEVEKFGFDGIEGFAYPWEYERRYKAAVDNKLKILIIRDSFGAMILPFVNELFSESLYIFDAWKYGLNKDIIKAYDPDIVIFLGLETHIDNMIKK